MIRAISMYAGLVALGLLAGAMVATIFVMGWMLHVIGCAALAVFTVALPVLFSVDDSRPFDRDTVRRSMWTATVAAAVLVVVVLFS